MPDKTLLVHTEQGAGDTIQFARYLPLIKQRVGKVLLVAPEPLQRLLAGVDGVDEIRGPGDVPAAAFDAYVPMMTVAGLLGTTLETVPDQVPYLRPPHDERWTMDDGSRNTQYGVRNSQQQTVNRQQSTNNPEHPLRVGIAWAGSPTQGNDRNRSALLAEFAPLLDIQNIEWHSLQVGEKRAELEALIITHQSLIIEDRGLKIKDWADTAAVISGLDLVISVDTGVVHLAGALGKPVWVLLCYAPDWRWLLDRPSTGSGQSPDSPWYPTARLFRQSRPQDWASVMAEVREALAGLAGGWRA